MIPIADLTCPGLGLVVLARSMRRTSAALSLLGPNPAGTVAGYGGPPDGRLRSGPAAAAGGVALGAASSPLCQTRLLSAPVATTAAHLSRRLPTASQAHSASES